VAELLSHWVNAILMVMVGRIDQPLLFLLEEVSDLSVVGYQIHIKKGQRVTAALLL